MRYASFFGQRAPPWVSPVRTGEAAPMYDGDYPERECLISAYVVPLFVAILVDRPRSG